MVSIGINKRLSVESGLSYTYLSSRETVKTDDILTEESSLKLHYLGIPLKVAYVIYSNNILSLYGSAGIMGEKLLQGTRTITYPVAKSNNITIPPIQWSASEALGVDFKLGKRWEIYCEPGISYYFDDGSDIYTVRKERPLSFNLQTGLRFSIR